MSRPLRPVLGPVWMRTVWSLLGLVGLGLLAVGTVAFLLGASS